jgi:hypothetical protein
MPTPKTPKDIQVFNGMAQYYRGFIKNLISLWLPLPSYYKRQKLSSGQHNANMLGKKSNSIT